jgi:thiamine pyrophosphokinase
MTAADCLIVGASPAAGGEAFYRALLREPRVLIAADGAGEWCAGMGRIPSAVVGDFDSARPGARARLEAAGVSVESLPAVKDVTDLEACVAFARRAGVRSVDFCAAFVARPDHTLASIGTVLAAADLGARVREPDWTGWALEGAARPNVELTLSAGATFSLLSPAGARGVTVTGARYALRDAALPALSGLGVSNVATSPTTSVSVASGTVLVVAFATVR